MKRQQYLATANVLALITVFYNLVEGLVSIWLGMKDGTFSLFGFGLDSFVEVISAVGVWHMLRRQAGSHESEHDAFERTALKVTGGGFYLLSAGLVITAAVNIYQGHRPETTLWGVVIGAVSIASMWLLMHYKVKVGRALGSDPILADAACTRTCLRLSAALLAARLGYELTGIGYMDSLGVLAIAWLSYREGREAFGKARGHVCGCCQGQEGRACTKAEG